MITFIMRKIAADKNDKEEKSTESGLGKHVSRAVGGLSGAYFVPYNVTATDKFLDKSNKYNKLLDAKKYQDALAYSQKVQDRWVKQNPSKASARVAKSVGALGAGIVAGDIAYRLGHKALDAYKHRFKDSD